MNCVFERVAKGTIRCVACRQEVPFDGPPEAVRAKCRKAAKDKRPTGGPGTELKALLKEIGFQDKAGCGCASMVAKMNGWSIEECHRRHGEIVAHLREARKQVSWGELLRASTKAMSIVPPDFWLDPLPWLVTEAIRRADAKRHPRPRFITSEQLTTDTLKLIPKLPPNISCVVGVARSGVMPASLLAMYLHLPLKILDQAGRVVDCGHGWRLGRRNRVESGPALIVDDTVGSGKSLKKTTPIAARHFGELIYATVYVNPFASTKPDLWVEDLYLPHILAWNFPNSIVTTISAFDLDGIICHDEQSGGPPGTPYMLPRREPVHIITGRSEKHRAGTLAWLDKWGVQVASLTMKPNDDERPYPAYKAEAVKLFAQTAHRRPFGAPMYIESCPKQAKRIAELSGVLTVCPITQEVFGPEGCWK